MHTEQFFFAQPQFRRSASDLELAVASEYYKFEVFSTAEDRDARCGLTANPDVRYVRATMEDIAQNDLGLGDIGCGVALDHPDFELIMGPLFDDVMTKLLRNLSRTSIGSGILGSAELLIARTRYTMSVKSSDGWITFPVEAMTVFEKADRGLIDRTLEWLHDRIVLTTSSLPLPGARTN